MQIIIIKTCVVTFNFMARRICIHNLPRASQIVMLVVSARIRCPQKKKYSSDVFNRSLTIDIIIVFLKFLYLYKHDFTKIWTDLQVIPSVSLPLCVLVYMYCIKCREYISSVLRKLTPYLHINLKVFIN